MRKFLFKLTKDKGQMTEVFLGPRSIVLGQAKGGCMKKMFQTIKNVVRSVHSLLGCLLRAPAAQPALQAIPVHARRVLRRK
jgi:hypothetical protein